MSSLPHPVLFIHGFDGAPENWTVRSGFRDFLIGEGGFDPDLVRLFTYGYRQQNGRQVYADDQDFRLSAHRLADDPSIVDALDIQVDDLSRDSVARGGPERVDLVGHSLGGIVPRYYLSCREPDQWGTRYTGKVGKLVQIGSPNLGVASLAMAYRMLPDGSFLRRLLAWLEHLPLGLTPLGQLRAIEEGLERAREWALVQALGPEPQFVLDSVALHQATPGSEFLQGINRPGAMPLDVAYYCLFGDIRFRVTVRLWGLPLVRRELSVGDFAIEVSSASTIPGLSPGSGAGKYTPHPCVEVHELNVVIGRAAPERAWALGEPIFPCQHSALLSNPVVQRTVLEILLAKIEP
jgi:pimeloyl-ACP methyl ester carboxylesterase